jgi:hypothetical protein
MRRNLALMTVAVLVGVLGAHLWAQPPWVQPPGKAAPGFQGYWMGVDPVDGGDARRSLVRQEDGTFALAARDSFFTLCDGTDRAFASFSDGTMVGGSVMQSNTLTIQCFNTSASVVLRVRYQLIGTGLMVEGTTTQDGSLVSTIVLHRVSKE